MKKFHKTVPSPFCEVYFFSFAIFSEYLESTLEFTLGARSRDKNAIFNFFETKMIYFKIFMGILSETLYLLLVF